MKPSIGIKSQRHSALAVKTLSQKCSGGCSTGPYGAGHDNDRLRHFIYYIDRHIELDGDNHGPKEREPLEDLLRTRRIGRSGLGVPHTAALKPESGFGTAH